MTSGNARIAKNTAIVYVRLGVTLVVGLLLARFVLQALGADGYGLYNVVGSVVAMFSFISSALSSTTTRFLNFEMGRENGDQNRIFNVCLVLHLVCAVVLLAVTEAIGLAYIHHFLRVTPGKEGDAMFVFQVSTTVACIGIANLPFQSLFTAHERFGTVAVIDIVNHVAKLAVAGALFLCGGNRLRIYAFGMAATTFLTFVAYQAIARRRWPQVVRWSFVRDRSQYKAPLTFNNYNLLSAAAILARSQGSNMLINFFFGTAVNAAYGIANTVLTYINKSIGNFDFASAPQITQGISGGHQERSIYLTETVCRMSVLMMLVVAFTLMPELDFLMHLWLGTDVPAGTTTMVECMILLAVVSATSAGLAQLINAYGNVKWYKISFASLYLVGLVVAWAMFRSGAPAYGVIVVFIVCDALCRVVQLVLLHVLSGFDSLHFLREAYLRPFAMCLVLAPLCFIYKLLSPASAAMKVFGIAVAFVIGCALAYAIGLKKGERRKIKESLVRNAAGNFRKLGLKYFRSRVIDSDWKKWKGYKVDWDNPRDLNEKIQWLICHGDTSSWSRLADKLAVRDFVAQKGLGGMLVPVYGHWSKASDIDWDVLPEKFVLKCNHDSGSTHVMDKSKGFDRASVCEDLDERLSRKYGDVNGETYYNAIKPCVMAEAFLQQSRPDGFTGGERLFATLIDYKIWCFDGKPCCIWACYDRTSEGVYVNMYDLDWRCHPEASVFTQHYRDGHGLLPKPEHLDDMLRAAASLSKGFPEVRVDFYDTQGQAWFGEMTFASLAGKMDFLSDECLISLGSRCILPPKSR